MNSPLLLLAASLGQAGPIAPPLPQASTDCTQPVYATDQLVCGDPALLALDRRLVAALTTAEMPHGRWIEDQEAWFRRSRLCAFRTDHAACITQAYRDRITILAALAARPPAPTASCAPGEATTMARANGGSVVLTDSGRRVAVATSGGKAWQPFVSYRRTGRVTVLHDFGGTVIARCRTKEKQP